jgi:hypothetical protein
MQLQTILSNLEHETRTDPKTIYKTHKTQPKKKKRPISPTEAVQCPSLPLEGINDVHGGDGLPPGVLRVRHGVTNDVLEEDLEDAACLLVDEAADPLDATSSRQTPNRRLRDALDVVPKHLPVPLRSSFAQALASLSSTRHFHSQIRS